MKTSLFDQLDPLADARRILDLAIEREGVERFWSGLTGGGDSVTAALVASGHPKFGGCVLFDTRTGVRQGAEYVRDLCRSRNWPLLEYTPPARQYADLVLEYGFPGPSAHLYMYSWLKERAIRVFRREQAKGGRIGLVTGVRRAESRRRMGTTQAIQRDGRLVWIAPLLNWDSLDTRALIAASDVPHNPVSAALGMSGECLCGAYAQPGELNRIARHFPEAADRIEALEAQARRAGVHADWETPPPVACSYGLREAAGQGVLTLCQGCEWKAEGALTSPQ